MRTDPPVIAETAAGDGRVVHDKDGTPVPQPPAWRERVARHIGLIIALLFALLILWLMITAPLSRSLQPVAAPSLTILSAEGEPIARRGAEIGDPVAVEELPAHVTQAFLAIEDRRFFEHIGIDPWGISRAMVRNFASGRVRQGGSTITQQLAKTSFLSPDRTAGRKIQEALIALWLEAWLSKEEILSRYLSNVYFGDNVYGLRAAAQHYFSREPEELTVAQAAMLAGMVNAPSRLAPTSNLEGAQERSRLVMRAMEDAGFLTEEEREALNPARLRVSRSDDVPSGTYFADWVLPEASELMEERYGQREVQTTLEADLQRTANRAIRRAGLGRAQAALVAMRPDGRVVAMVGGKNYRQSPFNRATQARRQPGSTFKLFVFLAALRAGYTPDTAVDDTPLRIGTWQPENYGGTYRGRISLREAAAVSSNVVAVRLSERVGRPNVVRAARDLGITGPLPDSPSLALGTANLSLLEMTAAYAAVASGRYPVRPHGLPAEERSWLGRLWQGDQTNRDPTFPMLRDLLYHAANHGTGRAAALEIPTFGKTGTTQDYRDALFIGFAGDLIVGVWIGNDDNSPLPRIAGGGLPAQIWRNFMTEALDTRPARPRQPIAPPPAAEEPAEAPDPSAEPGQTQDGVIVIDAPPAPQPGGSEPPAQAPAPAPGESPVRVDPPPPPPQQRPQPRPGGQQIG